MSYEYSSRPRSTQEPRPGTREKIRRPTDEEIRLRARDWVADLATRLEALPPAERAAQYQESVDTFLKIAKDPHIYANAIAKNFPGYEVNDLYMFVYHLPSNIDRQLLTKSKETEMHNWIQNEENNFYKTQGAQGTVEHLAQMLFEGKAHQIPYARLQEAVRWYQENRLDLIESVISGLHDILTKTEDASKRASLKDRLKQAAPPEQQQTSESSENVKALQTRLGEVREFFASFENRHLTAAEITSLRPRLKKFVLATHPDNNPNNPHMLEVSKLATTMWSALGDQSHLRGRGLEHFKNSLKALEKLAKPDTPSSNPQEPASQQRPWWEEPEPYGSEEEPESETETEAEPDYRDFREVAEHVERMFVELTDRHSDYGSRGTIAEPLNELCEKIAKANGYSKEKAMSLNPIKITETFSRGRLDDDPGNIDGDVKFMGYTIGTWGSLGDGYAFSVGDFNRSAFLQGFVEFINKLNK